MPDSEFGDARLKLQRAHHHLEEVFDLTRDVEEIPTSVAFDTERNEYFIYKDIPPLPPALALVIGDFVHSARAALDYAVFELASQHVKHPRSSGFPVCQTEDDFICRGKPMLKNVSPDARWSIEQMQPYGSWEFAYSLADLNKLVNIDKHRHIPLVLRRPGGVTWNMRTRSADDFIDFRWDADDPHRIGARQTIRPGAQVDFDPQLETFVAFGNFRGAGSLKSASVLATLGQIYGVLSSKVIPTLQRHLAEEASVSRAALPPHGQ